MVVLRSFRDEGRSGLDIAGPPALTELLTAVQARALRCAAILVLDVSRWGQFQDVGESAFYEQLCTRNPLATWLGQQFTWRIAFGIVGALSIITAAMIMRRLPENPHETRASPLKELAAFNRPQVWLAVLIGTIGFCGCIRHLHLSRARAPRGD